MFNLRAEVRCGRTPIAALLLAATLMFSWLGWWAVRTGLSDAAADAGSAALQRVDAGSGCDWFLTAVHYRPDLAANWRRAADCFSFDDPQRALGMVRTSLALNPHDWRAWALRSRIELQLGDETAARQSLQSGLQIDRGFQPHYEFAGLLLLMGDADGFWREMKRAWTLIPETEVPNVLPICWARAQGNVTLVTALLPENRPNIVAAAMNWELHADQPAAAAAAWPRLHCNQQTAATCRNVAVNLAAMLANSAYQDGQLSPGQRQGNVTLAVDVWNGAVSQGILPQPRVQFGRVMDGSFLRNWEDAGFSWQPSATGLPVQRDAGEDGNSRIQVQFSGTQPEQSNLIGQFVPVTPGSRYRLIFRARGDAPSMDSTGGLLLVVSSSPQQRLLSIPAPLHSEWRSAESEFQAPADRNLIRLSFQYERPQGAVRLTGNAEMTGVNLEPVSQ